MASFGDESGREAGKLRDSGGVETTSVSRWWGNGEKVRAS